MSATIPSNDMLLSQLKLLRRAIFDTDEVLKGINVQVGA